MCVHVSACVGVCVCRGEAAFRQWEHRVVSDAFYRVICTPLTSITDS